MKRHFAGFTLGVLFLLSCAPSPAQPTSSPAATLAPAPAPVPTAAPPTPAPADGALIESLATDRAAYPPGAAVQIAVTLHNRSGAPFSGTVALAFEHLGTEAAPTQQQAIAQLAPGANATLNFTWQPPATDFTGYRVAASALANGETRDRAATAVDVSSDWRKFPRYGFLSHLGADVDAAATVAALNRFHLNALQFYDWQWQHHRPYSPAASWPDIAGRSIARNTVTALIDQAHARGMLAFNYNLAYGAYDNYWRDGSGVKTEWGLFKSGGGNYTPEQQDFHPLPASWPSSKLYLFDPSNRDWQAYIFGQERAVFEHFAFDGWHIDTLGKRSLLWNWNRQIVNLPVAYADFVNAARAALGKRMVFNAVGGYGLNDLADKADVDVLYAELWENDGTSTYGDIANLIEKTRAHSDKALVLPAYMNRDFAQSSADGAHTFREPSVRLADATIFAAGADHLELGDQAGMLSKEYFPSQPLVMSDTLKAAVQENYDFAVAYENLLRDNARPAEIETTINGQELSANGKRGTIWVLPRATPAATVVHLINLKTNRLSLWRDTAANYPAPHVLENLSVTLHLPALPRAGARLRYATPDANQGAATTLEYSTGTDAQGAFVRFTLPRLHYWDMIWLEQ